MYAAPTELGSLFFYAVAIFMLLLRSLKPHESEFAILIRFAIEFKTIVVSHTVIEGERRALDIGAIFDSRQ